MATAYEGTLADRLRRVWDSGAGTWAWILHKITGWILLGYLFMHITVLSSAIPAARGDTRMLGEKQVDTYTYVIQSLEGFLLVRILELGLLAVAVFHLLNGLRLLAIDLGYGLHVQKQSFYVTIIITALITLVSIPVFLGVI